jgi:hypothetical protein
MGSQVEVGFRRWVEKMTESLTFIHLKIKSKEDLTEKEYEILRMMHKPWWYGENPVYSHEYAHIKKDEKAVQQELFHDKKADIFNGTQIEIKPTETKKDKKDGCN